MRVDLLRRAVARLGDLLDELIVEGLELLLQLLQLVGVVRRAGELISACLPMLVDSMCAPSFS